MHPTHEVQKFASRPCAVVGSVAGFSVDDYAYVCEALAARDETAAIELNISCPNVAHEGETFACDPKITAKANSPHSQSWAIFMTLSTYTPGLTVPIALNSRTGWRA